MLERLETAALFTGGATLSLGGVCLLHACQPVSVGFEPWFFGGLSAMTAGMILLYRFHPEKRGVPTILLFALILRIAFVLWPSNQDLNPSLYGPLAQLILRTAARTDHPVIALKLLLLVCDMGVLWLLVLALQRAGLALRHSWLYAAHPLPPLLLIGAGHLEPLLVLPLFAGFLAIHWGFFRRGLLLVGLATTIKISMAMILPFALRGIPKKFWPLLIVPMGLVLPFGDGFWAHLQGVTAFSNSASESFNSLAHIMSGWFLPATASRAAWAIALLFGYCYIWVLDLHRLRGTLFILGLFLLCCPVIHPWYYAILLPFAILVRSLPWLVLSTTATTLLYVTLDSTLTGHWQLPSWLLFLEFAPFFAALAFSSGRRTAPFTPVTFAPPTRLSILLPVYNEAQNLKKCLNSIALPPGIPAEILVIDGGSADNTLALAKSDLRVRCLTSLSGRGTQIAAGYRLAQGDFLIIVHADNRLTPDTIKDIWHYCTDNPHVAGGACTARHRHPALRFRITEILGDLRVRHCGIAFGDQVQFFRRAAISPEAFPDYRLMEDIELSIATRHAGSLALLHTPVFASHRRWEKLGHTKYTLQVIGLSTAYMLLRSLGMVRDKGAAFYRYYYGK